eukprot:CAMPEP_0173332086 /NCGR_PEP_ID=MMETSP1144-20121109/4166_1 /TAXON_ID=483371 /ORGANISM="non described non described, Strain CCMP2298" /LENGTH=182 /DNA_ID=CAMNT_0014276949 /DNA_START=268 /DNA_END=816 /DNA_ORIENTATION=-
MQLGVRLLQKHAAGLVGVAVAAEVDSPGLPAGNAVVDMYVSPLARLVELERVESLGGVLLGDEEAGQELGAAAEQAKGVDEVAVSQSALLYPAACVEYGVVAARHVALADAHPLQALVGDGSPGRVQGVEVEAAGVGGEVWVLVQPLQCVADLELALFGDLIVGVVMVGPGIDAQIQGHRGF